MTLSDIAHSFWVYKTDFVRHINELAVMVGRPSTPKLKGKITLQWTKKFYTRKDKGLSNGGCG